MLAAYTKLLRLWAAAVLAAASGTATAAEQSPQNGGLAIVDAMVALSSLIAISDGHLRKMADSLHLVAATEAARSGDWDRIRGLLSNAADRNVSALNWFALPDGSYWSVQNGKEQGNLSTRAYFPRVLEGETVLGDLVVSKATGKPVAIVAVPVLRSDGWPAGVLGASVYLDRLGARIDREMGLDDTMIFYSFDEVPLVALDWDPKMVFLRPMESGEKDLIRAFEHMLQRESGMVRYSFRGKERTVIFRKSSETDWWYAFGVVSEGRAAESGQ